MIICYEKECLYEGSNNIAQIQASGPPSLKKIEHVKNNRI